MFCWGREIAKFLSPPNNHLTYHIRGTCLLFIGDRVWRSSRPVTATVSRFFMKKKHLGDILFFLAFLFCLCSLATVIVFLYDEERRAEEHNRKIKQIDRQIEINKKERERLELMLKEYNPDHNF